MSSTSALAPAGPASVLPPLEPARPQPAGWAAVVGAALAVEAVATWFVVEKGRTVAAHWSALVLAAACFALAAAAVRRLPERWARVAVGFGCLVLVAVALHRSPNSSRDWLRYAWDGTVQLHGTDPYRYAPDAHALAGLREGFLRPAARCAVAQPVDSCFRVDRAGVHTIYPPVAQAVFAAVQLLTGRRAASTPFQVLGAGAVLGVTAVLLRRRAAAAAVWAWCPLVVVQDVNDAHIDSVATLFAVLGLTAATRVHPVRGPPARGPGITAGLAAGAWIGAGIATKVLPVLLLPALAGGLVARSGRVRSLLRVLAAAVAAVAVVAVGYLPHVLAVGPAVVGYLPGYLHEEGYADGERFHLLAWFVTGPRAGTVAVAVLLAVGLVAASRADPARPERSALLVVGVFLLVSTPTYPWYGGLLVAVAALADRPRWLVVAAAAVPTYGAAPLGATIDGAGRFAYTAAALVVVAVPAGRLLTGALRPRVTGALRPRVTRALRPRAGGPGRRAR